MLRFWKGNNELRNERWLWRDKSIAQLTPCSFSCSLVEIHMIAFLDGNILQKSRTVQKCKNSFSRWTFEASRYWTSQTQPIDTRVVRNCEKLTQSFKQRGRQQMCCFHLLVFNSLTKLWRDYLSRYCLICKLNHMVLPFKRYDFGRTFGRISVSPYTLITCTFCDSNSIHVLLF